MDTGQHVLSPLARKQRQRRSESGLVVPQAVTAFGGKLDTKFIRDSGEISLKGVGCQDSVLNQTA